MIYSIVQPIFPREIVLCSEAHVEHTNKEHLGIANKQTSAD